MPATPSATEQTPEAGGDAGDRSPDAVDDRAQQIDALFTEVNDWSEQLGGRTSTGDPPQPDEPDQIECPDVEPKDECVDTCKIADSICSNAEKICALAAELQERSADDKCRESKLSCDRAQAACCRCKR